MWSFFNKKTSSSTPAITSSTPTKGPENSVSLEWFLGLTGKLADGHNSSIRFRENIESPNIRLPELEAWVLQAMEKPESQQSLFALQDLVNSIGKRLDFGVHYGCYEDKNSDWLHFDGLWQIDGNLFATADVYSLPLGRIDFKALEIARNELRQHQDWVSSAQLIHLFLLADGVDPRVEGEVRQSEFHEFIRFLPLETLFELIQMYEEQVLTRRQLPMLFRPFKSIGIHDVLQMIEEFTALFEEAEGGFIPHPIHPVITTSKVAPPPSNEGFDHILQVFDAGNREEAEDLLKLHLKHHPNDLDALEFLGDLHLNNGNTDEGITILQTLLKKAPKDEQNHLKLATVFRNLEQFKKALEVLSPFSNPATASPALLAMRGECLRLTDAPKEAIELCRRLTNKDSKREDIWETWVRCLLDLNRQEDALSVIEQSRAATDNASFLEHLCKDIKKEDTVEKDTDEEKLD